MAALVARRHDVKDKGFDVKEERLVIQKHLGKEAQALAVELSGRKVMRTTRIAKETRTKTYDGSSPFNFKDRYVSLSVNLVPRRSRPRALELFPAIGQGRSFPIKQLLAHAMTLLGQLAVCIRKAPFADVHRLSPILFRIRRDVRRPDAVRAKADEAHALGGGSRRRRRRRSA